MQHLVMRAFREGEAELKPGDIVDATLWPNTPLLEAQRYLRAVPEGTAPTKPEAAPSRRKA